MLFWNRIKTFIHPDHQRCAGKSSPSGPPNWLTGVLKDESGQSALVIMLLVIVAAGVAISQLALQNSQRELDLERNARTQFQKIKAAIELYAIQDTATSASDFLLPCPAATGTNGVARSHNGTACNSSAGDNRGIVPWATIGLAESEVIDAQGNYITYVVHATTLGACNGTSAASDPMPDANGGSNAGYALISHGANGYGAYNGNTGSQVNAASASTRERDNCPTASGTCTPSDTNGFRAGPVDDTEGSTFFDDIVLGVSFSERFADECPELNRDDDDKVFVEDAFGDSSGNGDSDDLNIATGRGGGSGTSVEGSGYLTVTEDVEVSTASSQFDPSVTPLYTSIQWTPTAVGDSGGTNTVRFSIVTRSDISTAPTSSNDLFSNGVTVRFSGSDPTPLDAGDGSITIDILANGSSVTPTTSGSLAVDVNNPDTFELEVFDDGSRVWARITEVGDTTNQFVAYDNSVSTTSNTSNNLAYIHNLDTGASSRLDNLLIARGGIVLEMPTALGSAAQATGSDVWSSILPNDTSYTVEQWFFLRDTFATFELYSADGTIATNSLIRLNSATELEAVPGLTDSTQNFTTGTWTHVAFTCDSGTFRDLVVNGSSVENDSGTCDIIDSPGASDLIRFNTGTTNRVMRSEARVWSTRQTVSDINSTYRQRAAGNESNLYMHYRFDDAFGSTTLADSETTVSTENLTTLTNTAVVGFRTPFGSAAADVCPSNQHPSDAFACVYNSNASVTIPLDVPTVRVKAWGAGGGGSRSGGNGGGGGYAAAIFTTLGGTNVAGSTLNVTIGQAGGASGNDNGVGGGGGGGSAVVMGSTTAVVAAGGGGGGDEHAGAGGGDNGVTGTGNCGGNGASTSGASAGAALTGGCNLGGAGAAPSATGGDGGVAIAGGTANGGTGFGDGGNSDDAASGSDNAGGGGGGGYYGGGAGGEEVSSGTGGGGGGGSAFAHADVSSSQLQAGTGTAPFDDTANDRANACGGGSNTAVGGLAGTPGGNAGNNGCVIICWSSTCTGGL